METDSQAKRPAPSPAAHIDTLNRMFTALQKANDLMERHLAAGQTTVPARALYFILRDAGFGTSQNQKQELKQTPKQEQSTVNELHHQYGMRR